MVLKYFFFFFGDKINSIYKRNKTAAASHPKCRVDKLPKVADPSTLKRFFREASNLSGKEKKN